MYGCYYYWFSKRSYDYYLDLAKSGEDVYLRQNPHTNEWVTHMTFGPDHNTSLPDIEKVGSSVTMWPRKKLTV